MTTITRNLSLELVRVTEAAALMAGRWMGRGDKEAADQAAALLRRVPARAPATQWATA